VRGRVVEAAQSINAYFSLFDIFLRKYFKTDQIPSMKLLLKDFLIKIKFVISFQVFIHSTFMTSFKNVFFFAKNSKRDELTGLVR